MLAYLSSRKGMALAFRPCFILQFRPANIHLGLAPVCPFATVNLKPGNPEKHTENVISMQTFIMKQYFYMCTCPIIVSIAFILNHILMKQQLCCHAQCCFCNRKQKGNNIFLTLPVLLLAATDCKPFIRVSTVQCHLFGCKTCKNLLIVYDIADPANLEKTHIQFCSKIQAATRYT